MAVVERESGNVKKALLRLLQKPSKVYGGAPVPFGIMTAPCQEDGVVNGDYCHCDSKNMNCKVDRGNNILESVVLH